MSEILIILMNMNHFLYMMMELFYYIQKPHIQPLVINVILFKSILLYDFGVICVRFCFYMQSETK